MAGRLLIVDSVAPRRALMQAALGAARYEVSLCGDAAQARGLLDAVPPDVVLLDLGEGPGAEGAARAARAVRALRLLCGGGGGPAAPILALAPAGRADLRLAALGAGAEAALDRATPPRLLQARIRALIRARDAERELGLRDADDAAGAPGLDTAPMGAPRRGEAAAFGAWPLPSPAGATRPEQGMAEAAAPFFALPAQPLRATLVAAGGDGTAATAALGRLSARLGRAMRVTRASAEALPLGPDDPQDLYLIDASGLQGDPGPQAEALRRLVELVSLPAAQRAATALLLPAAAVDTAALALDLGAGEVLAGPVPPEEAAARLAALLHRRAEAGRLRDRIRSHVEAALRDPLTGLHNRRYAEPALQRMAERARRAGEPLAVLMLDIDHFKDVNDRWGHAAGDQVLHAVARALRAWLPEEALVARFGGEEFLVALPGAAGPAARAAADTLRRRVGACAFALAAGPSAASSGEVRVTLSVGVAVAAPEARVPPSVPELLARADAALYEAKDAGRDTVSLALGAA